MKNYTKALGALSLCLMLSSCGSVHRLNQWQQDNHQDTDAAKQQLKSLQDGQVVREIGKQWINPVPINTDSQEQHLPPCHISINRPGSVALSDVSAFIGQSCHLPVVVTQDAQKNVSLPQVTSPASGQLPLPDGSSAMIPLAQMSQPTSVSAPVSNTLKGLYYKGTLEGFLNDITTRLGLSWRFDGQAIRIFWLETKTFNVNFMDSTASFESKTVSGTTTSNGSNTNAGGISGDNNTSQTTQMAIKSDLYKDVTATVKSMLTPGIGRMNLSAGILTVTDAPNVLSLIDGYIRDRNKQLNRQVLFNIKVYSVENKKSDALGIDWHAVFRGALGLDFSSVFADAAADAMSGGVSVLNGGAKGSTLFINALAQQANVSVVTQASSITTNLSAVPIQVALQQDYVSQVTSSTSPNVGTQTSAEKATITTGFNMTVLPYLMPDSAQMQLEFSINMSDDPTMRTVKQGNNTMELMKTRLKTFTQRVNMKSGQTLVLSGYEQMNTNSNEQGVGESSFFGLGGGRSGSKGDTQLVILITPIIIG